MEPKDIAARLERLLESIEYGNITREDIQAKLNECIDELLEGEGEDNGLI